MYNKVHLVGRLGGDPILKETGTTKVADFTLATTDSYFDKRTKTRKRTQSWILIKCFGQVAEYVDAFLVKGDTVFVEGKLQTSSFMHNGEKRWVAHVIVKHVLKFYGNKTREVIEEP